MDESRVLAHLDRIDALDRNGAARTPELLGELLLELRGLLREAEAQTREGTATASRTEEVVARLRTALARDIIGM